MKILNLYAGIGGNRAKWLAQYEITAVEWDADIAAVYRDRFPNDELIIGDAHSYLLENYAEYDVIWTSPPCQSHSSFRFNIGVRYRGVKPVYPDMSLYQQILLLQSHFKGVWVVENVKPYYKPLIEPTITLQRHTFWSNKPIRFKDDWRVDNIRTAQIPDLQAYHQIDLSNYKIANKRQVLRNCVESHLGEYVLNEVIYG